VTNEIMLMVSRFCHDELAKNHKETGSDENMRKEVNYILVTTQNSFVDSGSFFHK